jgi:hypothetical protein
MIVVAAAPGDAVATLAIPSPQTTAVRLRPRDPTIHELANELCGVLRCAQGWQKIKMGASMCGGGALVDGAVFRHLVIFHQAKTPIYQSLFVFVG